MVEAQLSLFLGQGCRLTCRLSLAVDPSLHPGNLGPQQKTITGMGYKLTTRSLATRSHPFTHILALLSPS